MEFTAGRSHLRPIKGVFVKYTAEFWDRYNSEAVPDWYIANFKEALEAEILARARELDIKLEL